MIILSILQFGPLKLKFLNMPTGTYIGKSISSRSEKPISKCTLWPSPTNQIKYEGCCHIYNAY